MDQATPVIEATRRALLIELKRRGPCTARELAPRLGVSATAVRQHIVALARQGLVRGVPLRRGPGRPAAQWELCAAAERLFPDGHAALCADLAGSLARLLPERQRARVLRSLEAAWLSRYRARTRRRDDLRGRLRDLLRARNAEGYMAELRPRGVGAFEIIQSHCPVAQGAAAWSALCESERRVLRRVLGAKSVTLAEWRGTGARRCVLVVTEDAAPKNPSRRRAGQPAARRGNS